MSEAQSKIRSLKFPDNVRQNPYMLLGDLTDSSILLREIFDNSRDELIASKSCNKIIINNNSDLYVVIDNGRGIPTELSEDEPNRTQMDLALSNIYAGGKYDSSVISGGLHGIGSAAVNAVSNVFRAACIIRKESIANSIDIVKDFFKDLEYTQEYYLFYEWNKGILKECKVLVASELPKYFGNDVPIDMSTYVGFTPDETMVKSVKAPISSSWYEYTFEVLDKFYNKEISIVINGEEVKNTYKPYKYWIQKTYPLRWPGDNKEVSILLNWEFDSDLSVNEYSGCVNMITCNRGFHVDLASWIITHNLRHEFNITHKYLHNGLKFNIILLAKKVGYNSQTKEKLAKVANFTDDDWHQLDNEVKQIYRDDYDEVWKHVQRLNEYAESMQSLATRDYVKSMVNVTADQNSNRSRSFIPKKVKDCSSPNREECELLLCEGESAGGALLSSRDPSTQAVMGLRGKSMNTTYKSLEDIFENEEIKDIISAIGTGVDEYYNISNVRYGKIIIACLSPDTVIPLTNGDKYRIEDLYNKFNNEEIEVFSFDEVNKKVVPAKATIHKTRKTNKIVRVHLSNETYLDVTPDHKFLLTNGEWIEAKDLKNNDSLESLILFDGIGKYSPEYKRVYNRHTNTFEYLHREFCRDFSKVTEDHYDVHHIDFNPLNNNTNNLIALNKSDHGALHLNHYNKSKSHSDRIKELHKEGHYEHTYFGNNSNNGYNGSNEQKDMLRKMHEEGRMNNSDNLILFNTSNYHREQVSSMTSDNYVITLQRKSYYLNRIRKGVTENHSLEDIIHEYWVYSNISNWFKSEDEVIYLYNLRLEGNYERYKMLLWLQGSIDEGNSLDEAIDILKSNCPHKFTQYFNDDKEFIKNEYNLHNHKVVYTEVIDKEEQMYCLNVPEYHNFATDNGPFVHNCDADVDGSHIVSLLLGLFCYHMSYLIDNGFIYILISPLYEQDGNYIYPGEEDKLDRSRPFERFKGLGSLENEETRHRVLTNKETRRLVRVTTEGIQDAIACSGEKYFRKQMMINKGYVKDGYPDLEK